LAFIVDLVEYRQILAVAKFLFTKGF